MGCKVFWIIWLNWKKVPCANFICILYRVSCKVSNFSGVIVSCIRDSFNIWTWLFRILKTRPFSRFFPPPSICIQDDDLKFCKMILWVIPRFSRNFFSKKCDQKQRNYSAKNTVFALFFHFFKHGGILKKNPNGLKNLSECVFRLDLYFDTKTYFYEKYLWKYLKVNYVKNAKLDIFPKFAKFCRIVVKVEGFCEKFIKFSQNCWKCCFTKSASEFVIFSKISKYAFKI